MTLNELRVEMEIYLQKQEIMNGGFLKLLRRFDSEPDVAALLVRIEVLQCKVGRLRLELVD